MPTSLGKVLLAALPPGEAERVLAEPSRSGITARWQPGQAERAASLREVAERGWALTDEQLARGIRSVAAPLRGGEGRVIASMNVTVHAAETSVEVLTGEYLPQLLRAAAAISADWAACQAAPHIMVGLDPGPQISGGPSGLPSVTMPATGPPALLIRQGVKPQGS
jgi:IclR family pca regulon transcriptional regulator